MTANILQRIVAQSVADLAASKRRQPISELQRQLPFLPTRPGFAAAIRQPANTPRIIAELKKASPSKGLIRPVFPVAELASELVAAGCAALSVLTERHYFLGSLENLKQTANAVSIPLLRKDFLYDPYQLYEAKVYGASAVLLIAAMLEDAQFRELADIAHALQLDVLGEAHDEAEVERLLQLPTDLIGVNARNLRDFSVAPAQCAMLLRRIPPERLPIAESAIATAADLTPLRQAGARGFLIGEACMRAPHPGRILQELLHG